jgi:hypothetical protein
VLSLLLVSTDWTLQATPAQRCCRACHCSRAAVLKLVTEASHTSQCTTWTGHAQFSVESVNSNVQTRILRTSSRGTEKVALLDGRHAACARGSCVHHRLVHLCSIQWQPMRSGKQTRICTWGREIHTRAPGHSWTNDRLCTYMHSDTRCARCNVALCMRCNGVARRPRLGLMQP